MTKKALIESIDEKGAVLCFGRDKREAIRSSIPCDGFTFKDLKPLDWVIAEVKTIVDQDDGTKTLFVTKLKTLTRIDMGEK